MAVRKVSDVKRIVVKVGTSIITEEGGSISSEKVENIVKQISRAKKDGLEIALVSSGAIAAGIEKMGMKKRPRDIGKLQAVAAVGQGLLMEMYSRVFKSHGLTVGQILITEQDMNHRQQYLNARRTFKRLFEMGVVPIINENDTVATDEITFGDNDMLAALVAALIDAGLLVLLTDTAGLYTEDPRKSKGAKLIECVEDITEDIVCLGGETESPFALGGMSSKLQAVRTAVNSGVSAIIADGRKAEILNDILSGKKVGTYFPSKGRVSSRKHWIGYVKKSCGRLIVDDGAASAITGRGASLLPAGVIGVEGNFHVGDAVDIVLRDGKLIARGISNYDHDEAKKIMGKRSEEVERMLGVAQEIVHRDGLVVLSRGLKDANW